MPSRPGSGVGSAARDDGAGTPQDGLRENRRLHQAAQSLLETPRIGGAGGLDATPMELSRLRSQVASMEGEREMRVKLEKLLAVQTVQVDLQKELRMKTESLLQVEQQTSGKFRQQLEDLRRGPGRGGEPELESRVLVEERFQQAQQRIQGLERQLVQATAPETSDRLESQLRQQLEEQDKLIERLREQMAGHGRGAGQPSEGEVVRLQLLLQSRDKHLDDLSQSLRKAQGEAAESHSEVDVLKHQVRVLKKDAAERTDEMERQLRSERDLRAEIFSLQAKVEKSMGQHQDESRRSATYVEAASLAEERQRRIEQLERQLAEEQTVTKRERGQLSAESEYRLTAKEQVIKHQTTTVESLTRELKDKQVEVDKLLRLGRESPSPRAGDGNTSAGKDKERGGLLPPLRPQSPRGDDIQGQRSIESLHRQLKSKDTKIAKQSERLQTLTEMLEKRDQQLEELSSAKRDREKMQQQVFELEEVMKAQPRVVTHAEAERRLIEQEQQMREQERGLYETSDSLQRERVEKDSLANELTALRSHLAGGAAGSGALQAEISRLSADLMETRRLLDGRSEELRRLRDSRSTSEGVAVPMPDVTQLSTLPAMQRKLQRPEDIDRNLGRDVAVWLQERENKIESLNSTITLLRNSVDELRKSAATTTVAAGPSSQPTPHGFGVDSATSPTAVQAVDQNTGSWGASAQDAATSQQGAVAHDMGTSPSPAMVKSQGATTGTAGVAGLDAATSIKGVAARDVSTGTAGYPGRDVGTDTRPLSALQKQQQQQPQQQPHLQPSPPPQIPDTISAAELKSMSAEDIRNELLARRRETNKLEAHLGEKKQLIMKLIEEANLCNAEVASLQQTVQQSYKAARKQDHEFDIVMEERNAFETLANDLREALEQKETKVTTMFTEVQHDTSGNAMIDEVDSKVGWKLKLMTPRQHEIRHSMFLVLNRRRADAVDMDSTAFAQGLAQHLAISPGRIEIVEDARLPDSAGDAQNVFAGAISSHELCASPPGASPHDTPPRAGTPEAFAGGGGGGGGSIMDQDALAFTKRDLFLVNIADHEILESGMTSRSTVAAIDVLDQIRNDFIRGQRIGPIDGVIIDAVFVNHGDMVLAFDWPSAQAQLLLREGRVLAGKHAVITVHEVRDPYILRVVAYDTEIGQEFILYLNTRDVLLLLDTRDAEISQNLQGGGTEMRQMEILTAAKTALPYAHLGGPCVQKFREHHSLAHANLLDVIVNSLSFSVWEGQQILVASEMRIAMTIHTPTEKPAAIARAQVVQAETVMTPLDVALPERGVTRGLRPSQVITNRLFEDVLGLEGRLCTLSLIHTTSPDLREDTLRVVVYYPKTCKQVEACLVQPMVADKMRIVAEAGQLDDRDAFSVAIVVEEVIYPPAFVVRLTSVSIEDAHSLSPQEACKPRTHIVRVTKDGRNALHLPEMSFAVTHSTLRTKLMHCIGLSTPVQGPRETLVQMPPVDRGLALGDDDVVPRTVTGHVNERFGLTVQLVKPRGSSRGGIAPQAVGGSAAGKVAPAAMSPAMRAHLRAKYGKGKLLVRHGRMMTLDGSVSGEAIRTVVSVYERSQPYHHFIMSAYEPQTSREWELLADSIDLWKLFSDPDEKRQQALDLGNPVTRERLAKALVNSVLLSSREDEIVLAVNSKQVREHMQRSQKEHHQQLKALSDRSREPEVTGGEPGDSADMFAATASQEGQHSVDADLAVQPAVTNVQARAVGGLNGGQDSLIEQRGRDRLFTAQRRLAASGMGMGDLYKICIYDLPLMSKLHNYVLVATPIVDTPLGASGLPIAVLADPSAPVPSKSSLKTFTLKVDDKTLDKFLWDTGLLEPSRQEELLSYISQTLTLDEDSSGQLMLCMWKNQSRSLQIKYFAGSGGEFGGKTPAAHAGDMPGQPGSAKGRREVGGTFPLNMLRLNKNKGSKTKGPSLGGEGAAEAVNSSLRMRNWKKVCCKAQRFGHTTVIVTVSRADTSYKLSVYDPETSALYEMTLVTSNCSAPLSVLMERCDLGSKLDLVLCMHEVAFPHQVVVNLVHVPSQQEFNLKIGDDNIYTMIENHRRDGFLLVFDQLITWGCIGFSVPAGTEEQALANVFDETFAGHQVFDRTQIDDLLKEQLVATESNGGELRQPTALAPQAPKKLRVPVVRTQLDLFGKNAPPATGLTMQLLYHGEHHFQKEQRTVLFRIHKRTATNDIALTLRVRAADDQRSLPELPDHWNSHVKSSTAHGRPFETPALAAAEAGGAQPNEVTIWLQDKCSSSPFGVYGEFCEVPGFPKPLMFLITDEDAPRSMRVAVALGQLPFTVLFQVVLLETSETSAKVESALSQKPFSNRRVLQSTFQRYFGKASLTSSAAVQLHTNASEQRAHELRAKLDQLATDAWNDEHLGVETGPGAGGPQVHGFARHSDCDHSVDVSVLHMCTRKKLGRLMVFTIHRDLVGSRMYIRVVMHDPVTKRDSHLTLLHYTTQRLLDILRVNRDMLEECREMEPDHVKHERQVLRAEMGRLIIDHVYVARVTDQEGKGEELDHVELNDGEEVDYELQMRDIMDSSNAAHLTAKKRLLEFDDASLPQECSLDSGGSLMSNGPIDEPIGHSVAQLPRSLLDTKEDALVLKAEKDVSGRRVLVTFYNETSKEDILHFSHNVRVVVACVQTLNVLAVQDFHEDKLELFCERRSKRHLMSAAREHDLARELWDSLVLQHVGQQITGISFGGLES
mmetsp:Transcript_45190/g.144740  ORF Transcript_45190/g.144740 Transcript_45190/m.144740 type:complete len:2710 (-) Transcript_45190:80-8209(-)